MKKTNKITPEEATKESNFYNDNTPQYVLDSDAKDTGKIITSKYEFDLFNKEDDIAHPVYRVKFIKGSSGRWNLIKNTKTFTILNESDFKNKDLVKLHSVEGFKVFLECSKQKLDKQAALAYINKWLSLS